MPLQKHLLWRDRMNAAKLALALLSVCGISTGQLLLKLAALQMQNGNAWGISIAGIRVTGWLIGGVALLGISTLIWVSVLRTVPLNRAYPIMALAFVVVPTISYFMLGEAVSLRLGLGSLLIVTGLVVIYS